MTNEQRDNFYAIAEQLGHSVTHLQARGEQTTTVTVHDLEQLRALVRPRDEAQRTQREQHLALLTAGRSRSIPEDIQSYLYGNGELSTIQLRIAKEGLPVTLNLKSLDDFTMPHGETVIGPSTSPTVWNYGTLRFYSDSYLSVKNTYFTLNVQNLVMQYVDPQR